MTLRSKTPTTALKKRSMEKWLRLDGSVAYVKMEEDDFIEFKNNVYLKVIRDATDEQLDALIEEREVCERAIRELWEERLKDYGII